MKVIKKRLDDLKHPEKNVRIHSEQQIRELKRSLEKFGQTRALVVDENNVILIGNGLYEAMVSLGYQEASVYVKTELSENDKKKLMIADNKTYALGIDNLDTLNEFLEELQGDLDIPGYDEDDRRTLYERLEGKVLVVIVDHKDKAKNIYGTVTHNRARGTHLLEPMKKIVKELMDEGKTVEEIGKQLGMRPEEIFRLSDFSKEDFLKMMTKGVTGYSKAEFITKI